MRPRWPSRLVASAALAALAAAVGCSSRSSRTDAPVPPHYAAPERVIDVNAPPGTYMPVERVTADVLTAATANEPATGARPLNVLAISGGGQFGSYAAGLMVGWTCRGDRPEFDVVTGISSGALVATIVYAGPKYDPVLQRLFTGLRTEDVFRFRPIPVNILRTQSIGSSEPLADLIAQTIDAEFLTDMRAAHTAGRRLFVATMNLQTRRPVIWDLGAIACSGRPDADELVRKLVLATSSISGQSPAVEFNVDVDGVCYTEHHVDGGGVLQTFVRFGPEAPQPDPANPSARWLSGSNLYLIGGGKLYKDVLAEPPGFVARILSNVSATLYALFRADVWRLYTLCAVSGMKFHLTSIPDEFPTAERSTSFDPEYQRQLFAVGFDRMRCGQPWRYTPPGYEPGEEVYPRAGLSFRLGDPAGPCPVVIPVAPADGGETPPAPPAPRPAVVRPVAYPVKLFDVPKL